jgi:hypothetical protein
MVSGNWRATCRKLNPCFSPCTKVNSKWIKDLNAKPETLRLLKANIGKTLENIGISNVFD